MSAHPRVRTWQRTASRGAPTRCWCSRTGAPSAVGISARSPMNWKSRAFAYGVIGGQPFGRGTGGRPSATSIAIQTLPTGFSAVPPLGPATPVTDTPISVPSRTRAPRAICRATGSLTAPCSMMSESSTPSSSRLTRLSYAMMPPWKTSLAPGTSVSCAPTIPPVQLSATAMRSEAARHSSSTTPARVAPVDP